MKKPLLIVFLFVLGMVTLFAGTTGTIMGFVLDKDTGVPIESAKVTVVETGLSTGTDSSGLFLIAGLAVGKYSILVEKLGYQSVSVKDIFVSLDQTTTLSVEMKASPVEIKNPIVVTASRLLVNKDQVGAVTKIDHSQIVDMSSRDIFRAAQVSAGVVTDEDGQMKIRGTRESNTTFLLDGLSIMDPFHNTFGAVVNAKSIMGEVDVITGDFDAEYGNALGGVVNTVSKTPETKKYKVMGSFDTAKAIPDWFGDAERYRKIGEEEYDWDFEGPAPFLLKNKLGFIFTGQIFMGNSSTHSGYQCKNYEEFHDYHLKFDYKISPTDRLQYHTQYSFAWIRLKNNYAAYKPGLTGWPIQHQFSRFHHLLYNRSISSDTYFKLALSWFYSGIDFGEHAVDTATGADSEYNLKPFDELQLGDFGMYQRSRFINNEIRFDLSSDHYAGHKIKGGFDIQRIHTDLFWAAYYYYIDDSSETVAGGGFPDDWYLEDHIHEYYQTNGYIEDKWSLTDKLLLSYGLRFDHWGYIEKNNLKFQPRIGATYSLSPTTVLRANYSIKYQAPPVEAPYEYDSGFSSHMGPSYTQWFYWFVYQYYLDGKPYYNTSWAWGNPDISPEGANDLEFGLQQALTKTISLNVSAYKKWLGDIVSAYLNPTTGKEEYSNIASGYSKGLEFTLHKNFSNYFTALVTYTLMVAKGKNMQYSWSSTTSSGSDVYNKEVYLDYDQRNTINFSTTFKSKLAKVNFIWRYGSGYPYTPHDKFYDYGKDQKPGTGDAGEGDGIYEEGEKTYASDPGKLWNTKRYPAYSRADITIDFALPIHWFGGKYWFNLTCRNMFDHKNLRGAGGNQSGDLDPYTGKAYSYAAGGTPRRYTWGIKVNF